MRMDGHGSQKQEDNKCYRGVKPAPLRPQANVPSKYTQPVVQPHFTGRVWNDYAGASEQQSAAG